MELDSFQYHEEKKNSQTEMQKSTMPPKAQRLTVEEDALVSQVLEIVGGITLKALQTLEEPKDRDTWSVDEGDDSVVYNNEDQAYQNKKANTSCDFGDSKRRHILNTADERIPVGEECSGEFLTDRKNSEMVKEMDTTEEEQQELQTPTLEPMDQSKAADSGEQPNRTPEKPVGTCGESLQIKSKKTDMHMQLKETISARKGKRNVAFSGLIRKFFFK